MGDNVSLRTEYGITYNPQEVRSIKKSTDGNVTIVLAGGVEIHTKEQDKSNKSEVKSEYFIGHDYTSDKTITSLKNFKDGALSVFGNMQSNNVTIENSTVRMVLLDAYSQALPRFTPEKIKLEGDSLSLKNCEGDGRLLSNGILVAEKINLSDSKDFDVSPAGCPVEARISPLKFWLFEGNEIINFDYDFYTKGTKLETKNCKDINNIGPKFDVQN